MQCDVPKKNLVNYGFIRVKLPDGRFVTLFACNNANVKYGLQLFVWVKGVLFSVVRKMYWGHPYVLQSCDRFQLDEKDIMSRPLLWWQTGLPDHCLVPYPENLAKFHRPDFPCPMIRPEWFYDVKGDDIYHVE